MSRMKIGRRTYLVNIHMYEYFEPLWLKQTKPVWMFWAVVAYISCRTGSDGRTSERTYCLPAYTVPMPSKRCKNEHIYTRSTHASTYACTFTRTHACTHRCPTLYWLPCERCPDWRRRGMKMTAELHSSAASASSSSCRHTVIASLSSSSSSSSSSSLSNVNSRRSHHHQQYQCHHTCWKL